MLLAAMPCAAQSLTVFAAVSLTEALNELLVRYQTDHGLKIVTSFAASSALARQIERGAPADVFVSADQEWMDYLATANRIVPNTRSVLVRNRLVLIGPARSTAKLEIRRGLALAPMLGERRLAMGDPAHVPAGRYGRAALQWLGVWHDVEGKLAAAENVRAAVNYVARGEAALGIVYATDVAKAAVRIVGEFPTESHPAIEYPAAVVATSRDADAARKLLAYLRSAHAGEVFRRHGFAFGN